MSLVECFADDTQFLRLVRREGEIDLVTAALEIARDQQSDLDFLPTRKTLRTCIAELTHPVTQAGCELSELKVIAEYLREHLGLQGARDAIRKPEFSYLNRVVDTGHGIPLTLSMIYLAVANELGIPLYGVAAPGHFLTGLETDRERIYVDAFHNGRILTESQALVWLSEHTTISRRDLQRTLKPASDRTIIIRMLHNLKAAFGARSQWRAAFRVQQRLVLLTPSSRRDERDLAILTLKAGRFGEAINRLSSCLSECSPDERPFLEQQLKSARQQLPLCN